MAEDTLFRNNALPYPVIGFPWSAAFPIYDSTGTMVVGAGGLTAVRSKNANVWVACDGTVVEIDNAGGGGMYALTMTAAEMGSEVVAVKVSSTTSGTKVSGMVFYPRHWSGVRRAGTAQGGAADSITLDSGASSIDDFYNGCVVQATIDGTDQFRLINDYVGSTKVASVSPNFTTNPDSDDTFVIIQVEGLLVQEVGNVNGNVLGSVLGTVAGSVGSVVGLNAALVDTTISSRLAPTVAARTLDVTTTGNAGIDWGNVVDQNAPVVFGNTTVDAVASVGSVGGFTLSALGQFIDSDTGYTTGDIVAGSVIRISTQDTWSTTARTVTGGVVTTVTGSVLGNITGDVQGNVDGSVGSVAPGGIDSSSFAANAIDSSALATSAGQEIADEVLNRDIVGGASGNTRNVRNALRRLRNRVIISAATGTVFQEDDSTPAWTAAVTTAAGNPVTEIDPT